MQPLSHVRPLNGLRLQSLLRIRLSAQRAGLSTRQHSTRNGQVHAASSLPGPNNTASKRTPQIPFPDYEALKWCIPIAIGSVCLYVYILEPYKYKGPQSLPMRQERFAECPLIRKDDVSNTSSIFTLKHGKMRGFSPLDLWRSGTWSVEVKQPELQMSRF